MKQTIEIEHKQRENLNSWHIKKDCNKKSTSHNFTKRIFTNAFNNREQYENSMPLKLNGINFANLYFRIN